MSHIVEAKTSVVNPDRTLLNQATQLVAQQHQEGHIETYYLDFSRRRHPVALAIFTKEIQRGIGITVNEQTGELTFVGDSWAVERQYKQIQQEILQTYVSLATMQALQAMGYSSEALEGATGGQVVIQGVSYA